VFTLGGSPDDVQEAARALASVAVATLDLSRHDGAHPRFGVLDVVPFVPLGSADLGYARAARDAFASWAATALGLPCFLYGPLADGGIRTLPEVRRGAFRSFGPDTGPATPHPTAGATAVGARPVLVAYNLWVAGADAGRARAVASALRGPEVRALGFDLARGIQVSCNLLDPMRVGPAEVYDRVSELLVQAPEASRKRDPGDAAGATIVRAELVGLLPSAVLERTPPERWSELDLADDRTIEARIAERTPGAR
jgi:glutamate formiminotransferase / 5-formyltetrahydrofolate cyclo-ligase